MQLRRLVLENISQHKHLDWTFQPGVTGIFGPNGSGKSNALKAAYASLTNDFTRNPGTKLDNIRDVSLEGQKASIYAEWSHRVPFAITRSLRPEKHRLEVEGEAPLVTAKTVEARLQELLGVPKSILDNYVFIQQWQMAAFLSARPADRAKLFAHLCQTVVAEQLWDLLGTQLRSDLPLVGQEAADPAALKRQLKAAKSQHADAKQRAAAYNDQLIRDKEERAQLRQLVAASERIGQLQIDLTEKTAAYEKAKQVTKQRQTTHDELAQSVVDMTQTLEGLKPGAEAARDMLAQLKLLRQAQAQREDIERKLAEAAEQLRECLPPQPAHEFFKTPGAIDGLHEQLTRNQHQLQQALEVVEVFEETGEASCPTCGQSIAELIEQQQQVVLQLTPLVEADQELLHEAHLYLEEFAQFERTLSARKAKHTALQAQLNGLGPVAVDEVDEKKFNQAIASYKYRQEELQDAQRALTAADTQLQIAVEKRKTLWSDICRIKRQLESHVATPEEVTQARERLQAHDRSLEGYKLAKELVERAAAQIAEAQEAIAAAEVVRERTKAARGWVAYLEEARGVLQRDALPRLVHESYLESLIEFLNERLASFDTPFHVRTDEGLALIVKKQGGKERDVAWLSGGEMMVLAISFMLTVNQLFAKDLGMLVLDEPTAGMDEHNLDCLEAMLDNLSRQARQHHWQIIMITHEKSLARSFDHVLQL